VDGRGFESSYMHGYFVILYGCGHERRSIFCLAIFVVKNDPDLDFARTQTMVGRYCTVILEIYTPVFVL